MFVRAIAILAAAIIMAAAFVGLTGIRADAATYYFPTETRVCVQDRSGRLEQTRAAIAEWNSAGTRMFTRTDCGTNADRRHIIRVRSFYDETSPAAGTYSTRKAWPYPEAALGVVRLNRYVSESWEPWRECLHSWVIAHELGHAFGLPHTEEESVMGTDVSRSGCGVLSEWDRALLHNRVVFWRAR